MKLTLVQIHNAYENIQAFSRKELPFKISYNVCRNLQKLESEYKIIMEIKQRIFRKYGKEENGQINILPEKIMTATEELNALLVGDVEIDIRAISINDLLKDETAKVTLQELYPMMFMFDDGEQQ